MLKALGLAALLAFPPELLRLRTGVTFEPHPAWIVVLLFAARDGSAGLLAGIMACGIAMGVASIAVGGLLAASYAPLTSGPNLIAFAACLTVSWIASWHLRRQADLTRRLRQYSERAADTDAAIKGLRNVVSRLRARVDRASTSLSFLRDVATRLDGTDPVAAAEAAADLALARTGASAAEIKVGPDGFRRLLAVRDARGPRGLEPLTLRDADLKLPIRNANHLIGILALWGMPDREPDAATTHDLAIITSWCAPALASGAWLPDGRVERVGSAP